MTSQPNPNRENLRLIRAAWDHNLPAICPNGTHIKQWTKLANLEAQHRQANGIHIQAHNKQWEVYLR